MKVNKWGAKKKVELVRTRTQERGCEQLFYGIGVDSRRSKGERETKDHLERDFYERERGKAGWESWDVAKVATGNKGGLGGQCDGLMHLLAHQAMIIMMIMIKQTVDEIDEKYEKGISIWFLSLRIY